MGIARQYPGFFFFSKFTLFFYMLWQHSKAKFINSWGTKLITFYARSVNQMQAIDDLKNYILLAADDGDDGDSGEDSDGWEGDGDEEEPEEEPPPPAQTLTSRQASHAQGFPAARSGRPGSPLPRLAVYTAGCGGYRRQAIRPRKRHKSAKQAPEHRQQPRTSTNMSFCNFQFWCVFDPLLAVFRNRA
jgi:hypothetical protein